MSGVEQPLLAETAVNREHKAPARDAVYWRMAQRIAGSEMFARSEFLPKFLLYVCDRKLRGKTHEITEQQIGERVFGRPVGYNPGEDNIVRNYAGQLRKRLETYYESDGKEDEILVSIPRGSYVPVFQYRKPLDEGLSSVTAPKLTESTGEAAPDSLGSMAPPVASAISGELLVAIDRRDWRMFFLGFLICAVALGALLAWLHARQVKPVYSASHPLWSELFSNRQDVFIVPADSGLGILQNLTGQLAPVTEYANGKYLSNLKMPEINDANLDDLQTQRYTSIVDLNITTRLARLPEVIPDRFIIRYARDLRMEDLRNGNAVLLGAIHTDPWVNLFQQQLNFQFICKSRVNDCSIINLDPAPGERQTYSSDPTNPSHQTYAVISFSPNLNRNGHILLIGGLNMAGTQAAADLLFDDASIAPVMQRATLPNGSLEPFQLLIETGSLGAEALHSRVIASRYGP